MVSILQRKGENTNANAVHVVIAAIIRYLHMR
jgi:hypothetical protein